MSCQSLAASDPANILIEILQFWLWEPLKEVYETKSGRFPVAEDVNDAVLLWRKRSNSGIAKSVRGSRF